MREKLAYWTVQLRQERHLRRKALAQQAPHQVSYHRQREGVMMETITALKSAMANEH